MGEKAAEGVTNTDKGTVSNPETELKGAEVRDNLEPQNEGVAFEPLFSGEDISEAQLKGEDDAAAVEDKAATGPKGDDPAKKDEANLTGTDAEADAKAKAEAEAKAKAEADAKAALPKDVSEKLTQMEEHISGLTTAVGKERQQVKTLKSEIQRLSAENEQLKHPKEAAEDKEAERFKDFKELSDEEYESLVDEDPDMATKYLYKLNKYREYQNRANSRKATESKAKTAEQEIVNYGIQELEKVLPGITQGKNELAATLTDFAIQHGVDDSVLAVLTDPRTKVITPRGENLIIGDGAAQLVKLIKSTYEAVSVTPDRAKIEAELRPKLEAEIQEKIINKLKQNPSMGFRSLDALAGSGGKDVKPLTGVLTEAEISKLSPAELVAALGG